MQKTKQRGITLIALIITIIVMLILVAVTVATALNGGLFAKAKGAGSKTQRELDKERLQSAIIGAYNEKTQTIDITKLRNDLGSNWVIEGEEEPYTVTSKDGELFIVRANGTIDDENEQAIQKEWKETEEGITNGKVTVQIGDEVNYNELSSGVKTYATDKTDGAAGTTQYSNTLKMIPTTYSTEDFNWVVFGVNDKGQLELISTTVGSNKIGLFGEKGCLEGPAILNEFCDELYGKGEGALKARSLSLDDINKLAGIITEEDKKALGTRDYGSWFKYKKIDGLIQRAKSLDYNPETGVGSWSDYESLGVWGTNSYRGLGEDWLEEGAETTPVRHNYYKYLIKDTIISDSKLYNIITEGTYMGKGLASSIMIECSDYYLPTYGLFYIYDGGFFPGGQVCAGSLFHASNAAEYASHMYTVHPIVTLSEDIELIGNSIEGWNIQCK